MSEYIKREDAQATFQNLIDDYMTPKQETEYLKSVISLIGFVPAADVEPVVRCKDCKWYKTGVCDFLGTVTLDDDYCSIGARTERSGSGE